MADDDTPTFAIPRRPKRRYPRRGGVEYEGETVFSVTPEDDYEDRKLAALVEDVLESGPYSHGDWFDLPMPLYLVHDEETGDTFRVSVRDGVVEFHVLPATESAGLRAFYERLVGQTAGGWSVEYRTTP